MQSKYCESFNSTDKFSTEKFIKNAGTKKG